MHARTLTARTKRRTRQPPAARSTTANPRNASAPNAQRRHSSASLWQNPGSAQESSMEKVTLVTGAGSGIGRAVALAFAREGHTVVLAGRRPGALSETAAQAPDKPMLAVPTDVANPGAVAALFAQ